MATATASIALVPLAASSGSTAKISKPASSGQPCGTSSSAPARAGLSSQIVIGTNAILNNTSPSALSGGVNQISNSHSVRSRKFSWTVVKKWAIRLLRLLAAVTGLLAAYMALSTAIWTSAKDFRDDCRSQNVSNVTYPSPTPASANSKRPRPLLVG